MLAAATVGALAGGAFAGDALAAELPTPLPVAELASSAVPAVDAIETPAESPPATAAASAAPQDGLATVERTAQDTVKAVTPPLLPSVDDLSAVSGVVEKAAPDLADSRKTAESEPKSRPKGPASRATRPARVAKPTAAAAGGMRAPSTATRAVERTEAFSLLPREAGAASSRPPRPVPSDAAGTALLDGVSAGAPGSLSAGALSAPVGAAPEAGARLVPLSILLRRTLVVTLLERPG